MQSATASSVERHPACGSLRSEPYLERWGRRWFNPRLPDIDGRYPGWMNSIQPAVRATTLPVDTLAAAGGIGVSDDCGRYVCNGWLYTCLGAFSEALLIGFLHVPMNGWSVAGVCSILDALLAVEEPLHG